MLYLSWSNIWTTSACLSMMGSMAAIRNSLFQLGFSVLRMTFVLWYLSSLKSYIFERGSSTRTTAYGSLVPPKSAAIRSLASNTFTRRKQRDGCVWISVAAEVPIFFLAEELRTSALTAPSSILDPSCTKQAPILTFPHTALGCCPMTKQVHLLRLRLSSVYSFVSSSRILLPLVVSCSIPSSGLEMSESERVDVALTSWAWKSLPDAFLNPRFLNGTSTVPRCLCIQMRLASHTDTWSTSFCSNCSTGKAKVVLHVGLSGFSLHPSVLALSSVPALTFT
mmetsp:Transcript_4042/g.25396  ORF Transcript_4042/g.25396 Transcript_4042/m.25396 type:complete len:280 (-) Transcript_4042:155-994(-)